MANNKTQGLGLAQTRGYFQAVGIVSGVDSDNFYRETKTKSGIPMRMINFGLEINQGKKIYISLSGLVRDNVIFSKKEKEGSTTQKVSWDDRFTFEKEGYKLIGVNLGLSKTVNESGKEVNDKIVVSDFDACGEIEKKLQDGMSVFIKG